VPFDAALAFKRALREWLVRLGGRLEAALVSLPTGGEFGAAMQLHALCIGLWQMADAGPVVKRLLERSQLLVRSASTSAALVTGATTLLLDCCREAPARSRPA
jgi:hypothetical protein